jgi:hypothetical protein
VAMSQIVGIQLRQLAPAVTARSIEQDDDCLSGELAGGER